MTIDPDASPLFPDAPRRAIPYRDMTVSERHDDSRNPPAFAALLRMSDVASEEIAWLWERWIPAGMLTILGGHGGDGKSTVMASLIAALTTGRPLPDGAATRPTGVLLLSAEDDVATAIRPRLDLHGADPSRVLALQGTIRADGRTRWFDLQHDVHLMGNAIQDHGIGLVVIDPLSSYLPRSDRNNEGEIRDALRPLLEIMEATGVGVVGVMHVGKGGDGRRASQRLLGSTAFTALARSVLMLADQPDERQPEDTGANGTLKVLQVVKSNYSIPPAPQAFRRPLDAAIAWLGPADVTVEECFAVRPRAGAGGDGAGRGDGVPAGAAGVGTGAGGGGDEPGAGAGVQRADLAAGEEGAGRGGVSGGAQGGVGVEAARAGGRAFRRPGELTWPVAI